MTGEVQRRHMTLAYWPQIISESFKESPDERLEVYSSLAKISWNGFSPSDAWLLIMLKAAQDPWSRIRKIGSETLVRSLRPIASEKQGETRVQHLLALMLEQWSRAKQNWYEKEGLLGVFQDLLFLTPTVVSKAVITHILIRVVLPSMSDPQLPVRKVAVELTARSSQISKELNSFILDYIFAKLEMGALDRGESHDEQVLDGFLSCLVKVLVGQLGLLGTRRAQLQRLLPRLATHSAASVRQCVAEVWASRCTGAFEMLLRMMIEKAENCDQSDDWWRTVETILMALQEELIRFLSVPGESRMLGVEVRGSIGDSLYAALLYVESNKFEVSRMGKQILPLILQLWVRFSPSLSFLGDCCRGGAMKDNGKGNNGSSRTKTSTRFWKHKSFSTFFLPELVWFLSLRRHISSRQEEAVIHAVKQYVIPLFEVEGASDMTGALTPILLYAYFPESCGKVIISKALSVENWEKALSESIENIRYAVDFACVVRFRNESLIPLVSLWLKEISTLFAHQQCLALEAVKMAIASVSFYTGHKPFSFAYYSCFYASTMRDGGEEIPSGFYWLKQHYPAYSLLPVVKPVVDCFPNTSMNSTAIYVVIHDMLYKSMYLSRAVEPAVLHATRSLMLVECESGGPNSEAIDTVSLAVVSRLENVVPSWRSMIGNGPIQSGEMDKNKIVNKNQAYDDWDDSGSEAAVEGILADDEIKMAVDVFKFIVENVYSGNRGDFFKSLKKELLAKDVKILLGN